MNSYGFLAESYDQLTTDVDYPGLADYLQRHFARAKLPVHTVLDLACGTGSLTCELARRGYETIGADLSEEMLAVAQEKAAGLGGGVIPPLFLHQSMDRLDLYGTIDACVCCLDSVNYVTRPERLRRAFQRVHLFLMPGGIFVFDIDTPEKLRAMDGQIFLDETEGTFCVWRGEYSPRRRICGYGNDLFRRRPDGTWDRGGEYHEEYAYTPEELEEHLRQAGFQQIRRYGDLKKRPPRPGEMRLFFAARKGTEQDDG